MVKFGVTAITRICSVRVVPSHTYSRGVSRRSGDHSHLPLARKTCWILIGCLCRICIEIIHYSVFLFQHTQTGSHQNDEINIQVFVQVLYLYPWRYLSCRITVKTIVFIANVLSRMRRTLIFITRTQVYIFIVYSNQLA